MESMKTQHFMKSPFTENCSFEGKVRIPSPFRMQNNIQQQAPFEQLLSNLALEPTTTAPDSVLVRSYRFPFQHPCVFFNLFPFPHLSSSLLLPIQLKILALRAQCSFGLSHLNKLGNTEATTET